MEIQAVLVCLRSDQLVGRTLTLASRYCQSADQLTQATSVAGGGQCLGRLGPGQMQEPLASRQLPERSTARRESRLGSRRCPSWVNALIRLASPGHSRGLPAPGPVSCTVSSGILARRSCGSRVRTMSRSALSRSSSEVRAVLSNSRAFARLTAR